MVQVPPSDRACTFSHQGIAAAYLKAAIPGQDTVQHDILSLLTRPNDELLPRRDRLSHHLVPLPSRGWELTTKVRRFRICAGARTSALPLRSSSVASTAEGNRL